MCRRRIATTLAAALLLAFGCLGARAQEATGTLKPVTGDVTERIRLITDDTLLLRVVGEEDLTGTYVVRDDGNILLPIVNEVQVAGLTLAQATARIRAALSEPIIAPQISLELVKPAPRRVYVAGEVLKPGVLEWRDAPSLSKALNLAAGITERGDVRNVRLHRGEREFALDISRLIREGDFSVDVELEPGDQILIPERPRVTIVGPVPGAGIAYFEEGDTLYQLLSEKQITRSQVTTSGHMDISPVELRYVRVIRGDQTMIVNLDIIRRTGDPTNDIPLVRGDRIVIADRGEVFVAGRVAKPGPVDTRQAYTAGRAVVAAGGALQDAALDRCVIVHEGQAHELDLASVLVDGTPAGDVDVSSGDLIVVPNNNVLVLGAVTQPSTYGLRWRCKLTDALAAAGGPALNADLRNVTIMRDGRPNVIDMSAAFDTGVLTSDPTLSPDDVVIVPEAWVYLLGEARQPGALPYRRARTLREMLATCNGVTDNAKVSSTYIIRDGVSRTVDLGDALRGAGADADIALEPGDRVVIPELLDQRVYVTGQVATPRSVRVEDAPDVSKAIATAGGVTAQKADLAGAKIIRGGQVIPVDLHALYYEGDLAQNVALEPGDTIVVPENEEGFVYLFGLVSRQGPIAHFEGMTLSQALAAAGGYPQDARITEILVARIEGGKRTLHRVPFSALFSNPPAPPEDAAGPTGEIGPPTGPLGHVPPALEREGASDTTAPEGPVAEELAADLDPDPVLLRGDIVYVPERSGARNRRTILPWLGQISYWVGNLLGL
jgi:protein involved in polysaccharide export with SLBB domain